MNEIHNPALRGIPTIGLGTAAWASPYPSVPQKQVIELITFALTKGVTFFDTAPKYGHGLCEQFLGIALRRIPRGRYILASKVGGYLEKPDGTHEYDISREGILQSVEASLKRLGTDTIDILHIHDPDHHYREALDVAFPTLAELRAQGVIKAIGAGMNQWQMLTDFAQKADFDCFLLAGRYTLLEQGALGLLNLCQSKGIAVFLGGVYNSGILATGAIPDARYNYRKAPPEILERVRRIEAVCARYAVPLYVAAVQFPLAHPGVAALVIGSQSPAELSETLAAQYWPVSPELWADLGAEGLIVADAPVPVPPAIDRHIND
jgi:D-threo-aldose 1-dehydrogenase